MLADYQALVANAVRDDSGLITPEDVDAAIALAVSRYSLDRPLYQVADLAANGSATLALPAGWEPDFSALASLEYEVGAFPPTFVDPEAYGVYQAPSGFVLRLLFAPTSAVRATYSAIHTLGGAVDTLPAQHREAVSCWAAAYCYDQLAGHYAGMTDSTIQADRVDRGGPARDYANRAKMLRARYISELGIEEKRAAPAGRVVDLDLKSSRGQDRLTHPNRFR